MHTAPPSGQIDQIETQPSDLTPRQTPSLCSVLECDLLNTVSVPSSVSTHFITHALSPLSQHHAAPLQQSLLADTQRREAQTFLPHYSLYLVYSVTPQVYF